MWRTKKLSQVCDIQSGLWKGKKEPFTEAFVLRNTNFTAGGKFDYSDVALLQVETKQLEKRTVLPNDIILEKSGGGEKTPVGRVCLHTSELDKPVSLSNFTARLRVINEEELTPSFLHRFLYFLYISGKTEPMQRNSTGIRNLQISQYKDIEVPLPPLAEQQRIVAKLDAAFAVIENAKFSLEQEKVHYRHFARAAVLSKLEGIDKRFTKDFEQVCDFVRGPFGGSLKKSIFVEKGFAVYEQQHPINDQFDDFRYFITNEKFLEMERFAVQPGDVLMSCSGVTLGKTGIVPPGAPKGIINQALLKITPKENILAEYLQLVMRSDLFQSLIWNVSGGAAQPNVPPIKVIKKLPFPVPPVAEQKEILNWAHELMEANLEIILDKKLNAFAQLKSAILLQDLHSEAA